MLILGCILIPKWSQNQLKNRLKNWWIFERLLEGLWGAKRRPRHRPRERYVVHGEVPPLRRADPLGPELIWVCPLFFRCKILFFWGGFCKHVGVHFGAQNQLKFIQILSKIIKIRMYFFHCFFDVFWRPNQSHTPPKPSQKSSKNWGKIVPKITLIFWWFFDDLFMFF